MAEYANNQTFIIEAQNGSEEATEELIKTNYPLAVSLAKKFCGRGVETEDLIQLALIGMLKAIRTFDTNRGTAFSTYAVPLILGEIRKFLRDDGLIKVSRENKKNGAILLKHREEYIEKYGKEPHIEELCRLSGIDKESAVEALNSSKPVASIFEPLNSDGTFTVENAVEDINSSIDSEFDKIALWEAINKLSDESRQLIILRYYRDLSQQQTAEIMGLSQVKVSRKEKNIIKELKKYIS